MALSLALAGDTMLGRGVAQRIGEHGPYSVFTEEVRSLTAEADLFLLNLECCVSERGEPWPAPGKPFFFRAPPAAVETLRWMGVDAVTLANNHALDFGPQALADTLELLAEAGIAVAGAGTDEAAARTPPILRARGTSVGLVGVTDHPADFAAGARSPGVAYADLVRGVPEWLSETVLRLRAEVDLPLVLPHWGPNMTVGPLPYIREAASVLRGAGAALVAGHSAHVFHGVAEQVCYDLGDFIDDYAIHPRLHNDLGLLFLATFDEGGLRDLSAVPLALDYCRTRLAEGREYTWVRDRFARACADHGTGVAESAGRLVVYGLPPRP